MEVSLLMEYGWALLVLIFLEGLLAADNALVLAIMVKHLPEKERKKALFYGLAGAFIFRFASLFVITLLIDVWQVQAIGALYLMFIAGNNLSRRFLKKKCEIENPGENSKCKNTKKGSGLWLTVLKIEIADIAFAMDSILAAVALALTLPNTNLPTIGGFDGGKFLVVFLGGLIGMIIMRYAATYFVKLLERKPGLEMAAFSIVGWVGIKLAITTLAHPTVSLIAESFPKSNEWKMTFYVVLILIALSGWFLSKDKEISTKAKLT